MRIGYPCLNLTLGCKNRTFRLRSYSEERLVATVSENLSCLRRMLRFNLDHGILFFRISSDLIPFASHPICRFDWPERFRADFREIGRFIIKSGMRINMHPDQFTLINSQDPEIFERSRRELAYHARILDLMGLDAAAKIQIHVGGVYGDKENSLARFVERYRQLEGPVRKRLVIENDDRSYTLSDCLRLHEAISIPVVFDVLHHLILSSGENLRTALEKTGPTWKKKDGIPMVDYGPPGRKKNKVSHADALDPASFQAFLEESRPWDFDIMLEIKDKEKSALKSVASASNDRRFFHHPEAERHVR
jgi:UV DNA damage endonuclease